jgi:hypothetical protein
LRLTAVKFVKRQASAPAQSVVEGSEGSGFGRIDQNYKLCGWRLLAINRLITH